MASVRPVAALKTQASTGPRSLTRSRRLALQVGSVVTVLVVWQIVGMNTNPILFATPVLTAAAFADIVQSGTMLKVFPQSMLDLFTGFALAALVGITIGGIIGRSSTMEAILDLYINFAIPLSLVFRWEYLSQVRAFFGPDPFPYGLRTNRNILQGLVGHLHEQGLLAAPMDIDTIFARSTIDWEAELAP